MPTKRTTPKKSARKKPQPTKAEAQEIPRCGVVIRKNVGEAGVPCPEDAKYVIQMTDPNDPEHLRVTGILLLCDRHNEKFDGGGSLLLADDEGNLILAKSDAKIEEASSPPTSPRPT